MANVYEYGKRWNAKLPRFDITWLVNRMHVTTSDSDVTAEILRRASTIPATMLPACARYALCVHHANQRTFRAVATGRF